MDRQKTFDFALDFIRKQGKPSIHINFCMYRSPNGLKCAAGCLIPDEEYKLSFEGLNAIDGPVFNILAKLGHEPFFVRRLQLAHDLSSCGNVDKVFLNNFEECMKDISKEYGLVYKQPIDKGTSP